MNDGTDRPRPELARDEFLRWRAPRRGKLNPERMDNRLWHWLARSRVSAYEANRLWSGPSSCEAGPMCCFDRFGQSRTELPDGRVVEVGGEHEDHYDPDFFIYNDVLVIGPDGTLAVFGYPTEVFPPTDFHTATLAGERIVLVGSLGYPAQRRVGLTQVLALDTRSFAAQPLVTRGESPGWISRHRATLHDGETIIVSGGEVMHGADKMPWRNVDDWSLALSSACWRRLTHRAWPQWVYIRADRRMNSVWEIEHALWLRDRGWNDDLAQALSRLREQLGFEPELEVVRDLYRPDASVTPLPTLDEDVLVERVLVDGVTLKFKRDSFTIHVLAEGCLPQATIEAFQRTMLDKLQRLHGVPWTVLSPP
jgi:hypothetical protein